MANKLNISQNYYSELERGIKKPSFDVLSNFKLAFSEVLIDEIFF